MTGEEPVRDRLLLGMDILGNYGVILDLAESPLLILDPRGGIRGARQRRHERRGNSGTDSK